MGVDKITARKVTRYYVDGRGYSSLFFACRTLAKAEFKDLVYGKDRKLAANAVLAIPNEAYGDDARLERERRLAMSSLVAIHFPHDESCLKPYGCSRATETTFTYPSCKRKVDEWVMRRTRELMAEWKQESSK